jgi:hypothetical protein
VVNPKDLSQRHKQQLFRLETALGETLPDCGRYMLVIARRIGETASPQ